MPCFPLSWIGFGAVILAPLFAMLCRAPDMQIFGVMPGVTWPELSWRNVASEHYAHTATDVFEQHMGLRGVYTHLGNSVRYHAFGETRPSYGPQVGQGGVLFHSEDLIFYSQKKALLPSTNELNENVKTLAKLQRDLAQRGQALVPVLTPGKAALYPSQMKPSQRLDSARADGRPESDVWVYDALTSALEAAGVRYVDARALLTRGPYPVERVWGREGRHWTHFGACIVVRDVRVKYTEVTQKPLADYPCVLDASSSQDMLHSDYDLLRLMNVWGVPPHSASEPNVVHPGIGAGATGPSLFTIGTSFFETLAWDAAYSQSFRSVQMNYYNRRIFHVFPEGEALVALPHSEAWRAATHGKDLYVLDMFEVYFPGAYMKEFLTEFGADMGPPP